MKRWAWVPVVLAMVLASGVASAAQGDWLGRARIININPDASSSALNLDATTENTVELDFTYFVGVSGILCVRLGCNVNDETFYTCGRVKRSW